MGSEYGFCAFGLAEFFQDCEDTVADNLVIVEGIRLSHDHVREITVKRIAPQIADILRPFGILCNVVPMVGSFYSKIPRTAMDCQPSFMCLLIFTVFNEMIASAKCAETFIKDGLLELYSSAEIRDKTGVYARNFVNQFGSG